MSQFVFKSQMPGSAEAVWDWHAQPGALERLTPLWDRVRVLDRTGGLIDGTRITLSVPVGPLRVRWVSRQRDCVRARGFVDEQIEGPFASWTHTHSMEDLAEPAGASWLEDRIDYVARGGALGRRAAGWIVPKRLDAMFRYRHDVLRADLLAHARYAARPRLTVAVTGASGLIGSALVPFLTTGGHRVIRLVRHATQEADTARWDPEQGLIEPETLPRLDAVIHLAGEGVASGRWTEARKNAILRSRAVGTAKLAESLARLPAPPARLLISSGINYYGHREGDLTEQDGPGTGFLSEVCQAWEAAAAPAAARGIRVVHLRTGLVLSPAGGLLRAIRPVFLAGLGGPVGSGAQSTSWVSLDDVVGAFHHALQTDALWGPVNLTAPQPVTNRELVRTLGRVLRRPAILPAPAFGLRLLMGREMAEETALLSARVLPERLLASGYAFRHRTLEEALRHVLGRHE